MTLRHCGFWQSRKHRENVEEKTMFDQLFVICTRPTGTKEEPKRFFLAFTEYGGSLFGKVDNGSHVRCNLYLSKAAATADLKRLREIGKTASIPKYLHVCSLIEPPTDKD